MIIVRNQWISSWVRWSFWWRRSISFIQRTSLSFYTSSILRTAPIGTLVLFCFRSAYLYIALTKSIFLHSFTGWESDWFCASTSVKCLPFKIDLWWFFVIFVLLDFNHRRQWHFILVSFDRSVAKTVESMFFVQLVLKIAVHMSRKRQLRFEIILFKQLDRRLYLGCLVFLKKKFRTGIESLLWLA